LFSLSRTWDLTTNCPQKKKNKKVVGVVAGEALSSKLELDFSLIIYIVSSALGSVWYFYSGASFHMTRDKEIFSDLEERDHKMHIEMGDNGRYSVNGIGTINFHRESGKPFQLKDVMHVPVLKKKLVSFRMVEGRGYDVLFSNGKAFLRHKKWVKSRI
jgi:phage shock protein PspC (stress-responsive transcriptional regulator)